MNYDLDGGPAFPQPLSTNPNNGEVYWPKYGMTLRDYFAGQAMMMPSLYKYPAGIRAPAEVAKMAYEVADAMLKARKEQ